MIVLDNAGTRALSLITAQNGANVEVCFSDYTTSTGAYARGVPTLTTISSATTTSICATPASGVIRDVDYVNIKNTFAGSHTMTVQITSGSGGPFVLLTFTLLQDESMNYTHGSGWCAMDANGNRKQVTSSTFATLTVTGNATVGGTLGVTGVATFTAQPIMSSLTASRPVFTDASKGLVSNTMTGTGDVVMSTSPTLSTSIVTGTSFTFAAAATTLNIGNAGGTNTVLGTTTFSQAVTASSTLAVTGIASVGTGTAGSAGLKIVPGSAGLGSGYGAIYPENVSPSTTNYSFFARYTGLETGMNVETGGVNYFQVNGVTKATIDVNGINGVLGATTPAAATVTTLSASGIGGIGAATSATTNLNLAAGTTGVSTLRIPHGSAPSAPVDGDMWTTTAGLYIRINGGTVGPLS